MECPRCGNKKSWSVRRNKRKCAACKYEWSPQKLPLQLSRSQWRYLIRQFLVSETVAATANKKHLGRGQVFRTFDIIGTVMSSDIPGEPTAIPPGSQAPERVYVGYFERYEINRRQKFTSRNPIASLNGVYTLIYRDEKVWGSLISGQSGEDLEKILNESAGKVIPWSALLDRYTGVITKTRLYYFNHEGKREGGMPALVCFSIWCGLKELIAAKHGIRRERLPLYLGEIIWRSNFKDLSDILPRKRIFSLIKNKKSSTLVDRASISIS